ncbi:hypothetical protein [Liquorilactobacillus satsumensis]|nr:hypothetical protein [Liquorilactobacillus satsumensis]MCC7666923.1 hypothetical protein [Liquorilactobacillus satsumensis]MCP9312259.1 hypothetical protein [Liquorilactobacillus satsumensis]MCP9328764.1 hypothetical protein [Liquorilactobacillus satsumensis]MCP9357205.1 hypothetical protein [Liquorilactobacillus satsumensis]MCP9359538.1 hypothetical protein [Liquorilactobacillus satsumensis]
MEALKAIFKFMVASTLIVGGVLIGVTVFASKKIDSFGDKLQDLLHKNN